MDPSFSVRREITPMLLSKGEPCSIIPALVASFLGLAGGVAAVAGLGLAGCGGSEAPAAGSADAAAGVVGEVTYDGASSFQALVEAAAEQFMNENPDCVISGSGNGSGAGLTAVSSGTVTIGNSDVFAETKLDADAAAKLVDHEVAVVGMGPIVSKNVTVDDLTLEQLKGIFGGTITNWSEVGGEDAEIVVVNRKEGSGTRATFEAAVFGEEKNTYKPAQPEQDKSGDVQTLMGSTDNAISYIDFSHFDDSKFTAIKVGGVEPAKRTSSTTPSRFGPPSTCTAPRTPMTPPRLSSSTCSPMTSRASSLPSRASSRSPRWPW